MRSLTSLHENRSCSPQNFLSPAQNDFCNTIGPKPSFSSRERNVCFEAQERNELFCPLPMNSFATAIQFRHACPDSTLLYKRQTVVCSLYGTRHRLLSCLHKETAAFRSRPGCPT